MLLAASPPRLTSEAPTSGLLSSGARPRSLRPVDFALCAARLGRGLRLGHIFGRQNAARFGFQIDFQLVQAFEVARRGWADRAPNHRRRRAAGRNRLPALTSLAGPAPLSSGERSRSASRSNSALPMIVLGGRPDRAAQLGFAEQDGIFVDIDGIVVIERQGVVGAFIRARRRSVRRHRPG